MIRSSQSLMAEDVTVRCTVRRSATPSCKTYYGEGVEMTCTMRNWASQNHRQRQQPQPQQRQRQRQQRRMSTGMNLHSSFSLPKDYSAATAANTVEEHHHQSGPELLMTKIEEYRDDSPMRHRRQQRRRSLSTASRAQSVSPLERISQYSIPIDDLLLVETTATTATTMTNNKKKSKNTSKSNNNSSTLLYLSTISNGSFEFSGLTANGYDILLAFLRASIPADRILELQQEDDDDDEVIGQQHSSSQRRGSSNNILQQQSNNYYCDNSTLSSSFSCMDVDTLQDKHLQGRANAETLPEKVSRRVAQILHNLSDLSETVCERGLCCGRDGPPPTCSSPCNDTIIMTPKYALDALEMDENTTTTSSQKTPTNMNNEQQQQQNHPNQTTTTTTKTHPPHPNSNHHHQQPPQPKRASIPNLPSGLSVEHHDSGVSL